MDWLKKKQRTEKKERNKWGLIRNIIFIFLAIGIVAFIIHIAPDYMRQEEKQKVNLIINHNNVTSKMKKDLYVDENDTIYLAKEDLSNYFDKYLDYNEQTQKLVSTSEQKVVKMVIGEKKAQINGANVTIAASLMEKDGTIYIPFSELSRNVYNAEITYLKEEKKVIIDSLDRELKKADMAKKVSVKYKAKGLSKTIDKVQKGEKVVVISSNDGWSKIRTQRGNIGYVKETTLANLTVVRQAMEKTKQIEGKVSLVWDYYSESAKAPDRSGEKLQGVNVVSPAFFAFKEGGNGEILDNAGEAGKRYIDWAHQNGYKVWPIFSNSSMLKTTSSYLNEEEKRDALIETIVSLAEKYNVDGINLDFENMKQEDKDVYSQFVIELAPRLRDTGKVLSVDVTAPDGAPNWSLCFDRDVLADVADYMIFMAYDQYGSTSPKEGTTAGYNWVETNLTKFLGQEDVGADKLILGIPFYTRLWTEKNGDVSSKVVFMKDVDKRLPEGVNKQWLEDLRQNYVEYEQNGSVYKMWIEDEKSIQEKLNLMKQYNLAGVAFWSKGRETESVWKMVEEAIK